MKSTWVIHLIFMVFLIPIMFAAQKLSIHLADNGSSSIAVILSLFGIPVLYFAIWFISVIFTFKKKQKKTKNKISNTVSNK